MKINIISKYVFVYLLTFRKWNLIVPVRAAGEDGSVASPPDKEAYTGSLPKGSTQSVYSGSENSDDDQKLTALGSSGNGTKHSPGGRGPAFGGENNSDYEEALAEDGGSSYGEDKDALHNSDNEHQECEGDLNLTGTRTCKSRSDVTGGVVSPRGSQHSGTRVTSYNREKEIKKDSGYTTGRTERENFKHQPKSTGSEPSYKRKVEKDMMLAEGQVADSHIMASFDSDPSAGIRPEDRLKAERGILKSGYAPTSGGSGLPVQKGLTGLSLERGGTHASGKSHGMAAGARGGAFSEEGETYGEQEAYGSSYMAKGEVYMKGGDDMTRGGGTPAFGKPFPDGYQNHEDDNGMQTAGRGGQYTHGHSGHSMSQGSHYQTDASYDTGKEKTTSSASSKKKSSSGCWCLG